MIGEIINLSQELNSLLWDKLNSGAAFEDVAEIYYDTSMLDVMSGIEILLCCHVLFLTHNQL